MLKRKKLTKLLAKVMKNCRRIRKLYMMVCATGFCSLAYAIPAYATNPVENGKVLVVSWVEPLFYIGCIAFGGMLILKRRFTELFGFVAIAVLATLLIFYPENFKNFLGTVIQALFP
jgi:hypothetical protein